MTFWKTVWAVIVGVSILLWVYIIGLYIQCYFQDGCSMQWR